MKTVLAVDFDGTLCKDGFPHPQGAVPNVNLFKELIAAQKHGAVIILWTCRGGQLLQDAERQLAWYLVNNVFQAIKLTYEETK